MSGYRVLAGAGGAAGGAAAITIGPSYGASSLTATASTGLSTLTAALSVITATASNALSNLSTLFSGLSVTPSVGTATWTANYDYGASGVTQTGITGSGWTNINNATGLHNGTNATLSGNATAAEAGQLNFTYPAEGGNSFTISSVTLNFYTAQSGTVLSNGSLAHKWGIGNTATTLATFTGNVTNAPASYDITATIAGSWTNVTNIQTAVSASYSIANTAVSTCDAVETVIVATF